MLSAKRRAKKTARAKPATVRMETVLRWNCPSCNMVEYEELGLQMLVIRPQSVKCVACRETFNVEGGD